jgi:hypothetical protein
MAAYFRVTSINLRRVKRLLGDIGKDSKRHGGLFKGVFFQK